MKRIEKNDFWNLTADGANDRSFPEFRVDDDGIWLNYSDDELKSLTRQEREQIVPKGYSSRKPLLEFPCTLKQLDELLAFFGYWGLLDDEKSSAEAIEAIRLQDDEHCAKGRYTLNEAAKVLEKEGRVREERMTEKFVKAVEAGELAAYEPGADDRYLGKQTRTCYEEVYWDDLNDWLAKNEPRIKWRFPAPQQTNEDETPKDDIKSSEAIKPQANAAHTVIIHELPARKDVLSSVIAEAEKNALDPADPNSVWSKLLELALSENPPPPLVGDCSDGVKYRGKKYLGTGEYDVFTLKNLRDRMRRAKAR